MANIKSAKKRARQNTVRREHNVALRSRLRTFIKQVVNAIGKGDKKEASEAYKQALPVIDSAADKGIIHKNKAARHKSRLNNHIKTM